MEDKKRIDRIAAVIVAIGLILTICLIIFSSKITSTMIARGTFMPYERKLFDTDAVISLNIIIDQNDWQDLLDHAVNEEYYQCDVEVNGITFENVGIRAKGNSSLNTISEDPTTDRFSFKIKFDQYIKDQTCYGLDILSLNNCYSDTTRMKDYIAYDMFQFMGVNSPLTNYASISVNQESWGIYLAAETLNDSFALRNYGADHGNLYKPDNLSVNDIISNLDFSSMISAIDFTTFNFSKIDLSNLNMEDFLPPEVFESKGGTNLCYVDDNMESYYSIWEGSVFKTDEEDHRRVVASLQKISTGEELEACMDVDSVLRYLAVQAMVVNLDSPTNLMEHNYFLYEENSRLSIIPWDYNLSFGGYDSDASLYVNFPIDTPFNQGVNLENRRFYTVLLDHPDYLERYHKYLQQLTDEYVYNGRLDLLFAHADRQFGNLIKEDPTSFYTYEEYTLGVSTLERAIKLRADSVRGQLTGTIPSTWDGQIADSSTLIDTTDLKLADTGVLDLGLDENIDLSNFDLSNFDLPNFDLSGFQQ